MSVPERSQISVRVAAGKPPLQETLKRQGYTIDVLKDAIPAQGFVKAGPGPVTTTPIAAFGLEKRWPERLVSAHGQ